MDSAILVAAAILNPQANRKRRMNPTSSLPVIVEDASTEHSETKSDRDAEDTSRPISNEKAVEM